jgi:hypothetical protein
VCMREFLTSPPPSSRGKGTRVTSEIDTNCRSSLGRHLHTIHMLHFGFFVPCRLFCNFLLTHFFFCLSISVGLRLFFLQFYLHCLHGHTLPSTVVIARCITQGCAITQAEIWVHFRVTSSEFRGGQSGTGAGFSQSSSVLPC